MADFETAITYVLASEGGLSNDKHDRGGMTKFGITTLEAKRHGYLDVSKLTLEQAIEIYHNVYWLFEGVKSDRVATKLLDIYVNLNPRKAIKIIQEASGARVDGIWGPSTIDHINRCNEDELLDSLATLLSDWYVEIVEADITQLDFLKGWIRRAIRKPPKEVVQ